MEQVISQEKELYSNEYVKELEKELYSKGCVAESINFVVGEAKPKNFAWLDSDVKYIDEITNYLKDMSKFAPAISRDTESAFIEVVTLYCSAKLESRLENLRMRLKRIGDSEHVKSDSAGSMIGIIECARNKQYKSLFSNVKVYRGKPVIINYQPIYSWKNIIKRFIDEENYKRFMDKCSKKPKVVERRNLRRIIENKIKYYTSSLPADSDRGGNSPDPSNNINVRDEVISDIPVPRDKCLKGNNLEGQMSIQTWFFVLDIVSIMRIAGLISCVLNSGGYSSTTTSSITPQAKKLSIKDNDREGQKGRSCKTQP
ncbi:4503_t:CDS:2 [Funneliformis geosporum]|uniref:4503_t:CDS:1 n=1 Tax=Funneliformis geosporum TaxID=1117311 RepID=A0A9W4SE10_9GLOM|nr:4503_t:CDS:2 [Funneliformis geosporum]